MPQQGRSEVALVRSEKPSTLTALKTRIQRDRAAMVAGDISVHPEGDEKPEDSPLLQSKDRGRRSVDGQAESGDDNLMWVCLGCGGVLTAVVVCIIFATGGTTLVVSVVEPNSARICSARNQHASLTKNG